MLSADLADLYEVEPRALVQAVKRNIARFLEDFVFQLNDEEFRTLKSQIVISSWGGLDANALPATAEANFVVVGGFPPTTTKSRPFDGVPIVASDSLY
jgi:hypothetical protein